MNEKKLRIANLVFQIVPVMIGVFLAFFISNWAKNSRNKSKIILFKKNIIAEINSNRKKIKNELDYHIILRDSSAYYYQQKHNSKNAQFFKGIRTGTLNSSAFETGIQTGLINELSFEQIQCANNIHIMQKSYNKFSNLMLSGLITMDVSEDEYVQKKIFRFLSVSMTDLVIKERELLSAYDELLSKLKNE